MICPAGLTPHNPLDVPAADEAIIRRGRWGGCQPSKSAPRTWNKTGWLGRPFCRS